ncbi:hypothetical protein [Pontibacter actiniarum]|uniref:Ferritin n=1 Tax=Pontibacter actiniarum TaxID=323450 RepID=A0A1X9YS83_9BACT|nr:hypothetical protein [Pontibacter actiniarum]ARS35739.1 hypothetical protein CA264_09960 [Pontibacter actiniarum]
MKVQMLCLLLALGSLAARAQTFDEWFRQKKTQQKYLLEQLLALRLYGSYMQEGYGLAREGLSVIGLAEAGERDEHAAYFSALAGVRPAVATSPRVATAVALGTRLQQLCLETGSQAQGSKLLTPTEKAYVHRVLGRLLDEQEAVLAALAQTLSPGQLTMGDAARLERLDAACQALQELCGVARRLDEHVRLLALAKWQEQGALQGERQWLYRQGEGE